MEKNINKTAVEQNEKQRYYMQEVRKIVQKKSEELGRPLFCCTTTFGCQMNAHDSEKILGMLEEMGYVEAEDEKSADFIIYNTSLYFLFRFFYGFIYKPSFSKSTDSIFHHCHSYFADCFLFDYLLFVFHHVSLFWILPLFFSNVLATFDI